MLNEIKEDISKWKDIPCSWTRRLINIVKMTTPPKLVYRFNSAPIKIPAVFFQQKLPGYPKIHVEVELPRIPKTTVKKNKVGRLILPHFKIYYRARLVRTVWYWHKDRHIQTCGIELRVRTKPTDFLIVVKYTSHRIYHLNHF